MSSKKNICYVKFFKTAIVRVSGGLVFASPPFTWKLEEKEKNLCQVIVSTLMPYEMICVFKSVEFYGSSFPALLQL